MSIHFEWLSDHALMFFCGMLAGYVFHILQLRIMRSE